MTSDKDPVRETASPAQEQTELGSRRLSIAVDDDYPEFIAKLERAVPFFPEPAFRSMMHRSAPWTEVQTATDALATSGFIFYWKSDNTALMALAGNTSRSTSYLMGNHTIAETMYERDPRVMLYAPLRLAITQRIDEKVRFTIDQPSTVFASFDDPDIARTGLLLDAKLASLLEVLDMVCPSAISAKP